MEQTEQQTPLNFGTFSLTGITAGGEPGNAERLILTDGKTKLTLWASKKDGTPTKAKLAYDTMKPQLNSVISVGVKEEPRSFVNEKGETVNMMGRTIMWMGTPNENSQPYAPIQQTLPPANQPPAQTPVTAPQQAPDTTPAIPTVQEQQASEQTEIKVDDIPF